MTASFWLKVVCLKWVWVGSFHTDGVENGQVTIFRNNYFRDFHDGQQWWAGRVIDCKVPVDTLIFENNTTTGGCGLHPPGRRV